MRKRVSNVSNAMVALANGGSRATAMRCFCIECLGGQIKEIVKCTDLHCPLYPYRSGRFAKKDVHE